MKDTPSMRRTVGVRVSGGVAKILTNQGNVAGKTAKFRTKQLILSLRKKSRKALLTSLFQAGFLHLF